MNRHSDAEEAQELQRLRDRIIGLGDLSMRKSYYPELQQEQEALKESEARLRSILRASPVMQFVIDRHHHVISWNRAIETYSGIRAEDLVGTDGQWRPFYAEKRPVLADIVLDQAFDQLPVWYPGIFTKSPVVEDGYEATQFFPMMGADGKWLHGTAVPIRDGRGTVIGAIETLEDVTERKNAEDALKESEEKYRSLVEHNPYGVLLTRPDGKILSANAAACQLFGRTEEEIIAAGRSGLVDTTDPRVAAAIAEREKFGTAIAKEMTFIRKDGSRFEGEVSSTIFFDRNGQPMTSLIISDITERRQAEEQLRINKERLEKSQALGHVASWEFDPATGTIWGSDEGFRIYGMVSPKNHEIPIGAIEACIPERERVHQALVDLVEHGVAYNLEFAINPADGSPRRTITSIGDAVRDDTGRVTKVAGVIQDITDRKRMENALQLARNKINLLNAVTFHDIQAAAFSLGAYHELFRTFVTDEKGRTFLEKEESALKKIIDSLQFAKNYQDMGVRPPRWQDVGQVMLLAISHLDFLKIRRNFRAEGLEVYADPLLENVFFHLMQNVLLYGEHATEVTVRYEERPDGLMLFIEDNGVGIPDAEKQMVFDRGYGRKTGLGLFLVREVLSITGMTIRETGEYGKGARFEILVPKDGYRFKGNH